MSIDTESPWKVSLHGGHHRECCDHAQDPLEVIIEAAAEFGYHSFGVTEHAPRIEPERLYREEVEMGWDVEALELRFARYARRMDELIPRFAGRIQLLKGFEAEVVPEDRYVQLMRELRERHGFEYMAGSVHYVAGHIIDYTNVEFKRAVAACGGLEALAVRYYETVAEMISALRPEVAGHLDLVRRRFPDEDSASTPAIRKAAFSALEAAATYDTILDVNTAGYRKGLGRPYVAPWLVEAARDMGIPFCFGDDSHAAAEVGQGIEEAREYLLALGVDRITTLARADGGLARREIPLD